MKKITVLSIILASALTILTSCEDNFPSVPTTEPYLNITASKTTIALGDKGKIRVGLDRLIDDALNITLNANSKALTINEPIFSILPSSEDKYFETEFITNNVGEITVGVSSNYPGVRYATQDIKINVVKPKLSISIVDRLVAGSESSIVISSDMKVIEDVLISLISNDEAKLRVYKKAILKKGSKSVVAKMRGVSGGDVEVMFNTTNEKVEFTKNEESVELNKFSVTIFPKSNITFGIQNSGFVNKAHLFAIVADVEVSEDVVFTLSSSDETMLKFTENRVTMKKGTKVVAGSYIPLKAGVVTASVASDNINVFIDEAKKSIEITILE